MASEARKRAWRELGVVVLPTFDSSYQPLRVLKLSHRYGRSPITEVWQPEKELEAALKPPLIGEQPQVTDRRPLQKVSSSSEAHANVSADVKVLVEAAFGLTVGGNYTFELEFYSRDVNTGTLIEFVNNNKRAAGWPLLTAGSAGLLCKPSCAVITEVFYARAFKVEAGRNVELAASAKVGGQGGGGASGSSDGRQSHSLETAEFQPFAFRFILLSWNNPTWTFNLDPKTRPVARGRLAAPPAPARHEQDEQQQPQQQDAWPFDEPPEVQQAGAA